MDSANRAVNPAFLDTRILAYEEKIPNLWNGKHPMKGAQAQAGDILLRSNDYLCLAQHPHIIGAEISWLREHGHGESVSRVWTHHEQDALSAFEARAADLMQAESGVLCNSGYCANVGLIQAIAAPDTPVYIDMKAHASLWEGVRSAGAVPIAFRHNDVSHLERLVQKSGVGVIVVDALYSINGNLCPLAEVVEITERTGCALVVDETHSFGTMGPQGGGLSAALGLSERVHFRTVGLSKAMASRGGLVVGAQRTIEYIRYHSLPTIFSTSVLPHEVAGYNAALDVIRSEPWRRLKLQANYRRLWAKLDQIGYNIADSHAQIIALEAGSYGDTIALRDALESRGVFGAIFFPPATPEKRCVVRFTVNSGLTESELTSVESVCGDIFNSLQAVLWPSTRRKARHFPTTRHEVAA